MVHPEETTMSHHLDLFVPDGSPCDDVPAELRTLAARVRSLPNEIRITLEPAVNDALEQAAFRARVLVLAREALERMRHDIELIRFDLDQTRQEREELRRRVAARA
jgi:hypothetical protein